MAVLAHGWLNSMTVISGNASTVRDHHGRLAPDARRQLLEGVRDQADFLTAALTDIIRGSRAELVAELDALQEDHP